MKNEREGGVGGENIALQHKTTQLTSLPSPLFTAPRLMINGRVKVTQALLVFVSLFLQTIKFLFCVFVLCIISNILLCTAFDLHFCSVKCN